MTPTFRPPRDQEEAMLLVRQTLHKWKNLTRELSGDMEAAGISGIKGYPGYLPSFDEFAENVLDMELIDPRPTLTHDQMGKIGSIISSQSVGAQVAGQVFDANVTMDRHGKAFLRMQYTRDDGRGIGSMVTVILPDGEEVRAA